MTQGLVQVRRALLVEDFDELRSLLVAGLTRAGYEVTGAGSMGEALDMLPHGYDVVITDMSLGDAYGTQLLAEVAERDPDGTCRRLLITGGGVGPEPPPGVPVLVKPFKIDALVTAVRALFDDGTEPEP